MRSAISIATHIRSLAKELYNPVHVGDRGNHIDILGYWGDDSMATLKRQKPKSESRYRVFDPLDATQPVRRLIIPQ